MMKRASAPDTWMDLPSPKPFSDGFPRQNPYNFGNPPAMARLLGDTLCHK